MHSNMGRPAESSEKCKDSELARLNTDKKKKVRALNAEPPAFINGSLSGCKGTIYIEIAKYYSQFLTRTLPNPILLFFVVKYL